MSGDKKENISGWRGKRFISLIQGAKPEGIYIHVPFCNIKCHYCDFVSGIPPKENLVKEYFSALDHEIDFFLREIDLSHCRTIYFGGGTPGLFPCELEKLVEKILRFSPPIEEITVEVNPSVKFNPRDFAFATRISFGVQTFSEKHLRFLGRDHTPSDSISAIEKALSHFSVVSADILFGMPEQSPDEHLSDLNMLAHLGVHHISAYMLTPYEGTRLGGLVRRGKISLPDDVSEFFGVQRVLYDYGYRRYEVSNFAIPSSECVHNILYWDRKDFIGFGVSAWSKIENFRFANPKNTRVYISRIAEVGYATEELIEVDQSTELEEIIFLSLRKSEGLTREKLILPRIVKSALRSSPKCIDSFFSAVKEKHGKYMYFSYDGEKVSSIRVKEEFLFMLDRIIVDIILLAEKYFGEQVK